jgi:phosphatidylethanolamine/phosphatidyl-N-methylethanolamine N-methyltransferase
MANLLDEILKRFRPRPNGGGSATLDDARVVAAYARWAPVYDPIFGVITAAAQRAAIAVLNRLPPGRILELGVGTGITLPRYRREHRLTGVDLSPHMLERAEKRVARKGLGNVEALHEMDAGRLTMADGSFDAGVAMFVMTVVPEPQRVLSQLIRVVKPGGRVVLVNHFSAETGVRAAVEKWLNRFAGALGWNPDFPIATVLGRPQLRLIETRRLAPFGLYTLLVFERL